jgi:RNAse (barnase) inhibitor barstar
MTIDLTGITSKAAIHQLFKKLLSFEDWYGANWDAFWDSIVAIAEMPPVLTLTN